MSSICSWRDMEVVLGNWTLITVTRFIPSVNRESSQGNWIDVLGSRNLSSITVKGVASTLKAGEFGKKSWKSVMRHFSTEILLLRSVPVWVKFYVLNWWWDQFLGLWQRKRLLKEIISVFSLLFLSNIRCVVYQDFSKNLADTFCSTQTIATI